MRYWYGSFSIGRGKSEKIPFGVLPFALFHFVQQRGGEAIADALIFYQIGEIPEILLIGPDGVTRQQCAERHIPQLPIRDDDEPLRIGDFQDRLHKVVI